MEGILKIQGGIPLEGGIKISGSKFVVIPTIVSSLLSSSPVYLENVPKIQDVSVLISSLHYLGVSVSFIEDQVIIDPNSLNEKNVPDYFVQKMRGTFLFLPALLASRGHGIIAVPGGCQIGKRPFDEHIRVLESFGSDVSFINGRYEGHVSQIKTAEIQLIDLYPSPGATKTFLIMALKASGTSILKNASILPEVIHFISFLSKLGANIEIEDKTIVVKGGYNLKGCKFTIPPDRVECITWIIASGITKGVVLINNGGLCLSEAQKEFLVLSEMGLQIKNFGDALLIDARSELNGIPYICTGAYPEFNTDMLPIFVPLLMVSKGESRIVENVFEDRFKYLEELRRMGGMCSIQNNNVLINPISQFKGTVVYGHDIRATASLVIAGLGAIGETIILNAGHLERAYENFEQKANSLKARIHKMV